MKILKLVVSFLFALASHLATAQYYLVTSKGIAEPINLAQSNEKTILNDKSQNTYSEFIPLTFPFTFYGQSIKGFSAYSDGRLALDTLPLIPLDTNYSLSNSLAPSNCVYAFWDQTELKNFSLGGKTYASDVQTWQENLHGKKVQTILWRLIRPKNSSSLNAYVYYAVRLYETNEIDIIHLYGTGNFSATVGIKGQDNQSYLEVNGSPMRNYGGTNLAYNPDSVLEFKFIPGTQKQNNLALTSLEIAPYLENAKPITLKGQLINLGSDSINQFKAQLKIGLTQTEMLPNTLVNLAAGEKYNFEFNLSELSSDTGYQLFKLVLFEPNQQVDEDSSNNSLGVEALVYTSNYPQMVLHEVFSSSSTGQGKIAKEALAQTLNNFLGQWIVLTHPMNFPNFGDPYFMQFSADLFLKYQLNMSPALVVNGNKNWGEEIPNLSLYKPSYFQTFAGKKALVQIDCKLTRNAQSFAVNTQITPTNGLKSKQLYLHVALVEKVTYNNTRNNGETEFYHIVKALLPNSTGTSVQFQEGKSVQVLDSFTFKGNYRLPASGDPNLIINPLIEHSVENFENIYAVAYLQEEDSKLVLQSSSSEVLLPLSQAELILSEILVYPNPANESIQIGLPEGIHQAQISIRDAKGALVQPETLYKPKTKLMLPPMVEGIFIVEIKTEKGIYWKKLASTPLGNR